MFTTRVFLLLCLAAAALAYPALPAKAKRSSVEQGLAKDVSLTDEEFGPLEEVSKVLDRYARQIASTPRTPNGPKKWSPLHRAVLKGALQVTKQLLGYDGWTPNHLELLKGEQEILFEHVADDQGETDNRLGNSDKEEANNEEEKISEGGTANNGEPNNNEETVPQDSASGQA
ncbi:uncharacterized protein [Halyomorpha halys]|uniref:uncharacterized protein n=1 Tax=Halyomorpha halys TaxID=286706 RepID=UPI0006D51C14|nr:uncharacterized protein LOC106682270 [Halyomorpha halys]